MREEGPEGALAVGRYQVFNNVCSDTQVGTEAREVRVKGGYYREYLFCVMVVQTEGVPGSDGVFLRFGHLVEYLMEMMGL